MTHYDGIGPIKPWVQAAADELGTRFGITTIYGYGQRDNVSDHPLGLALDFMTRTGQPLADYARSNAARLGVHYVIWNQQIWNIDRDAEGWRPMANRGSPTANHQDHVHVSFEASGPGGGTTKPTTPADTSTSPNAAAVSALIDPLPWFSKGLKDKLDESTAGIVHAVSGLAIAGVLVAGGLALVVAGLVKSTKSS
ncbi:MAG: hypothetical protein HOV96_19620 [Nonomuraea sp.]|nr:hypothetical protein [Nonomuraea sp.]